MKVAKLVVFLLTCVMLVCIVLCSKHDNEEEHDHHDGESQYDHDDEHDEHKHESHYFDQDPHEEDPDYDEDVLTGTSHHEKRDAENMKKDIEELFKKVDQNNDNKIERNELLSHLTQSMKHLHNESTTEEFEKVDVNMDKKVSFDEFSIFQHNQPSAVMDNITNNDNSNATLLLKKQIQHEKDRFKVADNDGDGYLNKQEYLLFKYPAYFPHMAHTVVHDYIEDIDSDDDGTIDMKEYVSHFHIDDSKEKASQEKSLKKAEEDFVKFDKNKDGKINADEYHAILNPGYEEPARSEADYLIGETDDNKDGVLTLDEVEKHSNKWLGGDSLEHEDDDYYGHHLDDEL